MNTKRIGNIAEAAVLRACVQHEWPTLTPYGDVEPYDLVIDRGNGFERVQVKNGRLRNGVIIWNAYSTSGRTANQETTTYDGKVDLFGVYCADTDEVYLVPIADQTSLKGNLRVTPTGNGQQAHIKWAHEYLVR
jgi:hypothetical protein